MSVMAAQSQLSSGVGAVCRVRFAVVLVLMIGAPSAAASAGGQELTDVSSPARVTLGPVGLTPGLAIHTMGVDNNVFNEAEDPQRDFTGTIAPSVDGTMQMGRVAARLKSEASFIYYQKYRQPAGVQHRRGPDGCRSASPLDAFRAPAVCERARAAQH